MNTPEFLINYLQTLTPQQADQLWLYFDGCSNEHLIRICQEIALKDPKIAERESIKINEKERKT